MNPASGSPAGTASTTATLQVLASTGAGSNEASPVRISEVLQIALPGGVPAAFSLASSVVQFSAIGSSGSALSPGQSQSFSLTIDAALAVNGFWSRDASGVWANLASAAYGGSLTAVGNNQIRLELRITDGGVFDTDGRADGSLTAAGFLGNLGLSVVGVAPDQPAGLPFWL